MSKREIDEDYIDDDEDDEDRGILSKYGPLIVVSVAILAFGTLAWYSYQSGSYEEGQEEIAFVEAPKEEMREKPEDPGGTVFPNQDKQVYESMNGEKQAEEKVVAQPQGEEPMNKGELAEAIGKPSAEDQSQQQEALFEDNEAQPKQEQAVIPQDQQSEAAKTETPMEVKEVPIATKSAKMESEKKEEKPAAKAQAKTETAEKTPAKSAKDSAPDQQAKASASSGGIKVQLGAFKSEEEAVGAWKKIFAGNKDVLDGMVFSIQKVNLGKDKGTWFRLQAGPFKTAQAANSACKTLGERKQGCFIAKSS